MQNRKLDKIQAFHVMRILERAKQREAEGHDVVHMEVGEPDFETPAPVINAAQKAIATGRMHYTPATGLPELKGKIAQHYLDTYAVKINPEQVVITPGSSGALLLSLACLMQSGQTILVPDPGYPCNRNFAYFLDGDVISVNVDASTKYQLTANLIESNWQDNTIGVMLASPSNPTGTLLDPDELQKIVKLVESKNAHVIMDEIYHGLHYSDDLHSLLEFSQQHFVINSFSKYYGMTGWRVGWMVCPEKYLDAVDRFAQNIFLATATPSQYAALAAFDNETTEILQQRKDEFDHRRIYLLQALKKLGLKVECEPQGAFYIYANVSHLTNDSAAFCERLLEEADVAITPGLDFGVNKPEQYVRFAFTTSLEKIKKGVERLSTFLDNEII